MPNGRKAKRATTTKRRQTRRKQGFRESRTRDDSASKSIVRGISGIANSFIPGAGGLVSGISRYFGVGAYDTETASRLFANSVPQMHATLDEGIRICHHEYLCDVQSITTYGVSTFPINPGLSTTFPWLSTLASSFNAWKANGIVFFFKSSSSNALNSTNTALGQIIGCVDYNPYHSAPSTKITALGISGARDGKPSESNIYPVECKKDMTVIPTKLIRGSGVTDDLAKYDLGNFFIAANGSQFQSIVGELHVAYDITLMKPRLGNTGWNTRLKSQNHTNANPLGTTMTIPFNGLGISVDLVANTITIPAGALSSSSKVLFNLVWLGSAVSIVAPAITITNQTSLNFYNRDAATSAAAGAGVSTTTLIIDGTFKVTDGSLPVVMTFGAGGTLPNGTVSFDAEIVELDSNTV